MSEELYREVILDYYRNPRNYGSLPQPTIRVRDTNPLCGDEVELFVDVDGEGVVRAARFQGKGCAISQASASVLAEMVEGRRTGELLKLEKDEVLSWLGLQSLRTDSARIKCALLALKTLKMGVLSHLGKAEEAPKD